MLQGVPIVSTSYLNTQFLIEFVVSKCCVRDRIIRRRMVEQDLLVLFLLYCSKNKQCQGQIHPI